MSGRAAAARLAGFAASFARFPFAVRRFVARPTTVEEARARLRARLERREERFLALLDEIWKTPASPYLALLRRAGCEPGGLRARVAAEGVEGALRALRAADVYVTYEEIKGRRPIVRGSFRLEVAPADFDNPHARRDLELTTSGSTGLANVVYQDLDHIAELASNELVALDVHGAAAAPTVHWTHILPGSGIRYVLQRARHGQRAQRWFTPSDWGASRFRAKYDGATLYMLACLRAAGVRVARPPFVPPEQAGVVARAVRSELDRAGACLLRTTVSLAVRVAIAAVDAGLELRGAVVRVASEALTAAQRERIEAAGLRVVAGYGSVETGAIGLGCARPSKPDEVHLFRDAFALVDHPHVVAEGEAPVRAFNLTALRPASPKVLLNYQIDDCGVVDRRACGCPFAELGYDVHLHSIRSYTKLVSEGVTLVGSELLALLEDELPRRFGGSPLDWQLQEREDAAGLPRQVLVVSPRVRDLDAAEVAAFALERLRSGSAMGDAAAAVWRETGTLRVERGEPALGARGKFQPILRRSAAPPAD